MRYTLTTSIVQNMKNFGKVNKADNSTTPNTWVIFILNFDQYRIHYSCVFTYSCTLSFNKKNCKNYFLSLHCFHRQKIYLLSSPESYLPLQIKLSRCLSLMTANANSTRSKFNDRRLDKLLFNLSNSLNFTQGGFF